MRAAQKHALPALEPVPTACVHDIVPGHVPSQPAAEPHAGVPAQMTPQNEYSVSLEGNLIFHMQLPTPGPV
jgi:hypothetical protein